MTRIIVYQSTDPAEIDARWLAIVYGGAGRVERMTAGPSEEIARARLGADVIAGQMDPVLEPRGQGQPADDLV